MAFDPVKTVFDAAVAYLSESGTPEHRARSLVGKWRRDHDDLAILGAVFKAHRASAADPVPYIMRLLAGEPLKPPAGQFGRLNGTPADTLPSQEPWALRLEGYWAHGTWYVNMWGPRPGEPGCRAPDRLIHETGI